MSDGSVRAIPRARTQVQKKGHTTEETIARYEEMQGGYSDEDYQVMNAGATGDTRNLMLQGRGVATDIVPGMKTRPREDISDIIDLPRPKPSSSVRGTYRQTSFEKGQEELNKLGVGEKSKPREPFKPTYSESTGTDTGTGNREAPAPVARDRMAGATDYERYAAWAKANPTLAARVKPGQAGYKEVQQYLNPTTDDDVTAFSDDSGYSKDESEAILKGGSVESVIDSSGIRTTIDTPQTTSNPDSAQDGASPYADMSDQYRTIETPGYDPQEFLNVKLQEMLEGVGKKYPDTGLFK